VRQKRVQEAIEAALTSSDADEEIPIPTDLEARIQDRLVGSSQAWDQVLWNLVAGDQRGRDAGEAGDEDSTFAE
jgi:hypothetical protein